MDAESAAIEQVDDQAVARAKCNDVAHSLDLVLGQDGGEALLPARIGNHGHHVGLLKDDEVEKAQGAARRVVGRERELSLVAQVELVLADLVGAEQRRRAVEELGEGRNGADVGLNGAVAVVPSAEFLGGADPFERQVRGFLTRPSVI